MGLRDLVAKTFDTSPRAMIESALSSRTTSLMPAPEQRSVFGFPLGADQNVVLVPGKDGEGGYYTDVGGAAGYVTPYMAMALPTVMACNKVIVQAMTQAEARLVRTMPDGTQEEVHDHPVARMFQEAPNNLHTQSEMMDIMVSDFNLYGNAFAQIMYNRRLEPVGLEPLAASEIEIDSGEWTERGRIVYHYAPNTTGSSKTIVHEAGKLPVLLHIRQNVSGEYPYEGRSPITFLRETISAGLLATEHNRRVLSGGGHAQMALGTEQEVTPNEQKQIGDEWRKATKGMANMNNTPVLGYGIKPMPLAMTHGDMQFLEQQKWTQTQLCGVFRVPPPMIADLDKANLNNMRELFRSFNRLTMSPIFQIWMQAINRDLLMFEPDLSIVFRSNEREEPALQAKIVAQGIKDGYLTPLQGGRMMGVDYPDADNLPSDEYRAASAGFGADDDQSLMPDDDDDADSKDGKPTGDDDPDEIQGKGKK